jgi:hypothetical protein
VEKLYHEFLTAKYGELRAFVNDFGYFEITSKSDDDVIAHISIRDTKEYNSSLNIHLSHRDNVMDWFNVSETYSKFIVKSFIFNHFNVDNSNQLRILFHRELIGVLNDCV